jgi:hypothetical protein
MKYNGIVIQVIKPESVKLSLKLPGTATSWSYYRVYCIYTGRIIEISFSDIEKI